MTDQNTFLERTFRVNTRGIDWTAQVWKSPNGLAYDAVGNEVDIGNTVKILSKYRVGQVFVVEEIHKKDNDVANVRLWKHGWMNSTEILKIGESE